MELLDILQQIGQQTAQALAPAELVIGTVTTAEPLEISIDPAMDTLRAPVLYRTAAVVEKKIPILRHNHTVTGLGHSHSAPEGTLTRGHSHTQEVSKETGMRTSIP